ncbi:MAG: hypothetical protein ACREC5_07975 [Thermoplasmata archaeon]
MGQKESEPTFGSEVDHHLTVGVRRRESGVGRLHSCRTVARANRDPEVELTLQAFRGLTHEPVIGKAQGIAIDGGGFAKAGGLGSKPPR